MIGSGLWREIESGNNPLTLLFRVTVLTASAFCLIFFGALQLSWPQQAVLGLLMLLIALWLGKASNSYLVTLTLMIMSMFSTFRYGFWRVHTVVDILSRSGREVGTARRILHPAVVHRRRLCLLHSVPGILPDHLAAAARTCAPTR